MREYSITKSSMEWARIQASIKGSDINPEQRTETMNLVSDINDLLHHDERLHAGDSPLLPMHISREYR